MDPLHKRAEKWEGIPFASVEEVADLVEEFMHLVATAGNQGIELSVVAVQYPDKEYSRMPLTEFRQLVPALSLDDAWFYVAIEPGGLPKPVGLELTVPNRAGLRPSVQLSVSGTNEVAVNGVDLAAKQRIEKLYERKRQAEEAAAAAKVHSEPAPEARWRRFVYNPYTVAIVAGLVVLVVGIAIGLLIGST